MSHVRKIRLCGLVFLISLATFSGAHAAGPRTLRPPGEEPRWAALPPLARLWDWLLGWLPSGAPADEPPRPVDGGEAGDDLGPEMDPNGNPATRTP